MFGIKKESDASTELLLDPAIGDEEMVKRCEPWCSITMKNIVVQRNIGRMSIIPHIELYL